MPRLSWTPAFLARRSVRKPSRKERNRVLGEKRAIDISTEVLSSDLSGFARSLTRQLAYMDLY